MSWINLYGGPLLESLFVHQRWSVSLTFLGLSCHVLRYNHKSPCLTIDILVYSNVLYIFAVEARTFNCIFYSIGFSIVNDMVLCHHKNPVPHPISSVHFPPIMHCSIYMSLCFQRNRVRLIPPAYELVWHKADFNHLR